MEKQCIVCGKTNDEKEMTHQTFVSYEENKKVETKEWICGEQCLTHKNLD